MEKDNLHWNSSKIDGTQKAIRFAVSGREDGKSTTCILKAWNGFKTKGGTTIVFRRLISDISEFYIESLFKPIKKFTNDNPVYKFSKKDISLGVVPVYVNKKMIFLIVALAVPKTRYKSYVIENPYMFLFDEFICDTRAGEKYLAKEVFRFKEAYSTFYREGANVPCYFLGNPYSLSNPYFIAYKIDARKLARERILTGPNWVCEYHALDPELIKMILAKNPLHQFGDDYFQYAIQGIAVNDQNIRINPVRPNGFKLSCAIVYDSITYGVYRNTSYDLNTRFWIGKIQEKEAQRKTICFEFADLADGVSLFSRSERERFVGLANAIRLRKVDYETIDANTAMEEIYHYL